MEEVGQWWKRRGRREGKGEENRRKKKKFGGGKGKWGKRGLSKLIFGKTGRGR
jgi:hypothetical protein